MIKKVSIIFLLVAALLSGCSSTNDSNKNDTSTSAITLTEHNGLFTDKSKVDMPKNEPLASEETGYILPDSGKRLIADNEIENFGKFTLLLAKNEIFARKGYKFNQKELLDYFSNMEWYKPIDGVKGTYESLNEIEKKNFDLINEKWKKVNDFSIEEQKEYNKSIEKDINGDGIQETIKVVLKEDNYKLTISSAGKDYVVNGNLESIQNKLYMADFDVNDKFKELYINYDGPSSDPGVVIFRFTGNKIQKINELEGYIDSYDGKGKIYSEFSRTNDQNRVVISYYELGKGQATPPRSEIINKYLQYDSRLILFNNIKDDSHLTFMSMSGITDINELQKYIGEHYTKAQIAKITNLNEKLQIIDIDYDAYSSTGEKYIRNIPIKVKASDGKQGWIVWPNGGD